MNDNILEDDLYTAPVEILSEFLPTLMARNYKSALYYCKLILLYEPDNETVQEFYPLIQEKVFCGDTKGSDNEDECESSASESSTEYFSSLSVNTEYMSSSNSSDESEGQ